jgi:hypothetical protein
VFGVEVSTVVIVFGIENSDVALFRSEVGAKRDISVLVVYFVSDLL